MGAHHLQACLAGMVLLGSAAFIRAEVREVVPRAVQDAQPPAAPHTSKFSGFLGARLDANAANRLVMMDEVRLLDGFRNRPGRQAWEGEHAGKWLHAATLTWDYTQDPRLKDKLDRVATELGNWQLEDGYLGTYLPDQRWTEWDVWTHKYDMIGLLTYYQFTGTSEALEISRRCADLLCRSFGTGPEQRDLLQAGWHQGMAPTSVLEPMVLLYRYTGEQTYLDFCRYILAAWESPDGPKIVSTLLSEGRVDRVGNAKGYEMLSCLNGLLEVYRTTGEEQQLEAALRAWQDIVENRLYITGSATYGEHFHGAHDLPNGNARVAETCVTVTWIQFNAQLLRLTGEARFADELERSVYNHLFGAQRPDGRAWGYYVELEGRKPYADRLAGHCCLSSGPRGVALIPTFAVTTDADGIVINLFGRGRSVLRLPSGDQVSVDVDTDYPANGRVRVVVDPETSERFTVKLRIPSWSRGASVVVNGRRAEESCQAGTYAVLERRWNPGDVVDLLVPVEPRMMMGDHGNIGRVAFAFGPLVLAADDALNPNAPIGHFQILPEPEFKTVRATSPAGAESVQNHYSVGAILTEATDGSRVGDRVDLVLLPFAEAGSTLKPYQVWLPIQQAENVPARGANVDTGRPGSLGRAP